MSSEDFIKNTQVREIISSLKKDLAGKKFSDVIDDDGNQYVDLVQEGGGVLGIALLGYTYVLEQAGIRAFSLAGTSAGAINTLMLASADKLNKCKTEKILDILARKNLFDFIDAPFFLKLLFKAAGAAAQSFIMKILRGVFILLWLLIWFIPIVVYLFIYRGLNPGKSFRSWIISILKRFNINSTKDLDALRTRPGTIKIREGINREVDDLIPKLKIIAAEITTETRVIFPEMGDLFWDSPGEVNPADFVRASMSIPVFFRTFEVVVGSKVRKEDWENKVKYNGHIPVKAYFVDGGVLSNFPIDVFHNPKIIPRLPTFGVKLGYDRDNINMVNSFTKFLFAIFNSARHVLDYQFLLQNRDYEKLITRIDIGKHNWLNFNITDSEKIDLFIRGAKAASEFLREFDWEGYKKIRAELVSVPLTGIIM